MSQDIAIKEGELSRQFGHINKLKIAQSGGGDTLWVPEDEVQTNTLYVDKNGVYDAHAGTFTYTKTKTKKTKKGKKKKVKETIVKHDDDLQCYGWEEVDVNIIKSVTGKDINGNEHAITVGDNDFLQDEMVPSYIDIITPPDRTSYYLLEPIDTKGMVVMAYYGDGTEWGEVPREEYTLDPMVATQSGEWGKGKASSDLDTTPFTQPIHFTEGRFTADSGLETGILAKYTFSDPSVRIVSYRRPRRPKEEGSSYWYDSYYAIFATNKAGVTVTIESGNKGYEPNIRIEQISSSVTIDGKTVYYFPIGSRSPCGDDGWLLSFDSANGERWDSGDAKDWNTAWTLFYGDIKLGGDEEITVKWNRPSDDEELTDTFNITVQDLPVPVINGGDNNSGGGTEPIITPHI